MSDQSFPERGTVIRINLNPTEGREQQGEARPCLVLSHTAFNQARNGLVIVSPITSTLKPEIQTLIPIPADYRIKGSVIAEQVRTVDLSLRWWRDTGEIMAASFVDQVVSVLKLIVD
ncbi:type II toxin-antitoxin system PemK/MazF family toxin [Synechocystis sp. FACHB-383]|uniref:type II toxin-antitoxin system PemK/MazF family toxin n=1 Tax=Synechocystis sp. FACHB-383 TaxID=2692864 RepID=UPI001683ADF4|nr:type II toxin-antitoxin system PemK/MazF family toxin [Synechocystis sp. FACHB-383]MBD2652021.1 type II toxin-antitoxin system PemK/MazF family toxin [Synechocystis sp. FACHB-383]